MQRAGDVYFKNSMCQSGSDVHDKQQTKISLKLIKMQSPAIIDLRPSHLLLNPHFDGYKLSLEPIPILKAELADSPRRVFTNDDQYSFLHAKLFSLHNHLFRDPWLNYSCYFVDENFTIQNVRYDTECGKLNNIKAVHKMPKSHSKSGDYNSSLTFVSEKFCVFADGCGNLSIFNTGDRYRTDEWKTVFSDTVLESSAPFILQDARWEIIDNVQQIQCLLLSVQRKEESENEKFEAVIDWIVLKKNAETNKWNKFMVRQLKGNALPEYCSLEPKCGGLLLSADRHFAFTFDTENPIVAVEKVEDEEREANPDEKKKFVWTQSDEDVTIQFEAEREASKHDFKVICDGVKLSVRYKNEVLIDVELFEKIDNDLTTWSLENDSLTVTLNKFESSFVWSSLSKSEVIIPTDLPLQEIREMPLPSAVNLRSEMEECDYGDEDMESEYIFARFDAVTHAITHKANFGPSNGILFTINLRATSPPAFALRSDVDVCLWLPTIQPNPIGDVSFQMKHEGTLNAIGYVQASKQQKKFIQCSPDMNYTIICEPHRHIFVYKANYDGASGLKNRNSSQKVCIGQQKLITMDETDEVLGIICENEITILLTQKHILCLQINS